MLRRSCSLAVTLVFSAVFVVTSSQTAGAASFTLTGVAANLGCVPQVTCPNFDGDRESDFAIPGPNNGGGFVSVTDETDGFNDTYFDYSAAANAHFGRLQARASGTYDLPIESTRVANAFAGATDQLTISAQGLDGQDGTLDMTFVLDGVIDSTVPNGAGVVVIITVGPSEDPFGPGNDGVPFEFFAVPSQPLTFSTGFRWGVPFYLHMLMAVGAGTPIECFLCEEADAVYTPVSGTGTSSADLFHTLELTGLVPTDATGDPIVGLAFKSDSGAQYSVEGVVPEPASLLLLGTGLAATATFRRRRRS